MSVLEARGAARFFQVAFMLSALCTRVDSAQESARVLECKGFNLSDPRP